MTSSRATTGPIPGRDGERGLPVTVAHARGRITSQFDEDAILGRLFDALEIERGIFCEFGAWDGRALSNTYQFYLRGWRGVYIEGDPARAAALDALDRSRTDAICAYVTVSGESSIDALLARSRLAADIAREGLHLMSIDIDSDDLAVWRGMRLRPRVVAIEYNATIPLQLKYENPPGEQRGNSARSIYEFARSIDYRLVGSTQSNLIFLDSRARHAERIAEQSLLDIDTGGSQLFFFGMDGTLMCAIGEQVLPAMEFYKVPWQPHFLFQPVPKTFRAFGRSPAKRVISIGIGFLQALATRPRSALAAYLSRRGNRRPSDIAIDEDGSAT